LSFLTSTATLPAPQAGAAQGRLTETGLRMLRWLQALCVILPVLAFLGAGSYRYVQMRAETQLRLDRSLRIAAEHALKVLDTSESLLGRVQDLANAATPPSPSTADQAARGDSLLHQQLRALAEKKRQLQGIWIFDTDGALRVTNRFLPAPAVNVSDRAYFRWHREGRGGLYISQPMTSRSTGESIFDLSIARRDPQGRFGGVVSVSLLTQYFIDFHSELIADEPGMAITMMREDGTIFSRTPEAKGAPASLAPNSPVMTLIRQGVTAGRTIGVSSVDGRERLLAFQKVGDYPVYVGTGMGLGDLRARWAKEMAWLASFCLPPMLGLFFVARLALRRSRDSIESAQRLRHEMEARRQLEDALLQSQKLEALGRLTGGVAHDFNNALMVLSNNLAVLKIKKVEGVGPQVESMGRAIASATKLTRQLLAFSRRQAMVAQHTVLQERLPAIGELLNPVLGSQVRLDVQVAADTRPIRIDAAEFELALINLAVNSRHAIAQNGCFRISARNAEQDLPPLLKGPMVVVEASDDGRGIEPDVLAKVFEPFFTTKPVGEGTGLGLSQVYGLCHRAGGLATIDSAPGRGTVVRMFFPPDSVGPDAARPDGHPPRRDLGKHVLVVEDNPEVAAALRPVLEALGCTVTALDRAADALDWLGRQAQLPDLVLTDVVMPGEMDGLALAQQVRGRWPALKVVMMTGYAEQMDGIVRMGFTVLPKPCSVEMLAEAIEAAARAG
jgi:signal transduction histidine kinase